MKKIFYILKELFNAKYLPAYWVYNEAFITAKNEEDTFDSEEVLTKKELLPIGFNKAIILDGILKGEVIKLDHDCWMKIKDKMVPITFKEGRVIYV